MVKAGEALCVEQGLDETELFMWVDVLSIPQKNVTSKLAAIESIAVYACCSRYFVTCAPETTHADSGIVCNPASYLNRGVCIP